MHAFGTAGRMLLRPDHAEWCETRSEGGVQLSHVQPRGPGGRAVPGGQPENCRQRRRVPGRQPDG
eukprot:3950297-Alexandrium_andersonii.AAC.1